MTGTRERAEELARALEHAPGAPTSAEVAALLPVTAALTATGTALASSASAVTLPAGLASGRAAMVAAATAHHAATAAAGAAGTAGAGSGLAAAGVKAGVLKLGILALPGWLPVVTGVAAVAVATAGVVTTTTDAGSSHRVVTEQSGPAHPLSGGRTPSAGQPALLPAGSAPAAGTLGSAATAAVPVGVPAGPAPGASVAAVMADADQQLTTVAALLHADPSASVATLQKIAAAIVGWRLDVAHVAAALGTTRAGIVQLQTFVREQLRTVSTLAKSLPASTVQALAPVTTLLGQFSTAIQTTLSTVAGAASGAVGSVPGTSLITNLPLPLTLAPSKIAGAVTSGPAAVASLLHPTSPHPAGTHPASLPAVHVTPVPVTSLVPGLPTLPVSVPLPLPVKAKTSAPTTVKTTAKPASKAPVALPSLVTPSGVAGLASTVSGAVNTPVSGTVGTVTGGLGGILGH